MHGGRFFLGIILLADFIGDWIVERVGWHTDIYPKTPRVFEHFTAFQFQLPC